MKTQSKQLTLWALVFGLALHSSLQGAVQNAAWLQGNTLDNGSNDLAAAPGAELTILWTSVSSIDGGVFDHSITDASKLIVKTDGDYFVAFNAPITLSSTVQRATQLFQVYVNGSPVDTALTQSTYLRNAPAHVDASGHFATLVPGLSAGDEIEIKTARIAQNTLSTDMGTASLYVERVDESETAFFATSIGTTGGPDVNRAETDADREFVWDAVRADAGITHSNGGHEIGLSEGQYLVYVNIPIESSVVRPSPALQITLDGFRVNNGLAEQGYIRSTGGHNQSSLHWSGLIDVSGDQTLVVDSFARAVGGEVTIPANKPANIFIHGLPGTDGVFSEALFDDFFEFNLSDPTPIPWNDPNGIVDASVYSHADFTPEITVNEDGSYLVVYNDDVEGGNARANPIIKLNVNGQPVPGAEIKSHYIRQTEGHFASSGTMVFLLDNLESGDVITVTTQQADVGGTVFGLLDSAGAILAIVKKPTFEPDPASGLPPRINLFTGNVFGFTIQMTDQGGAVNPDSVEATLNGENIDADVSKDGFFTTVNYQFERLPDPNSVQTIAFNFQDESGNAFSNELEYTVAEQFTRLSSDLAVDGVNTGAPGFNVRVTQLTDPDAPINSNHLHGTSDALVELQLVGINPVTGEPYTNEAQQENHVIETYINWDQAAGADVGNFNLNNGYWDDVIPGILTGVDNGIAAEILTYLELDAGYHTLGVNSDDGFKVLSGRAPRDLLGVQLGIFDGGRGVADSLFNVAVDESGIYPVRLTWWEGTGGASLEFFSVVNGEKILINDTGNPNAIRAYREGPSLPYISRVVNPDLQISSLFEADITAGNIGIVDGSIQLTLDGETLDPDITESGGVTTVSYDHGAFFSGGEHTITLSYDEETSPPYTRTATVDFVVPRGQLTILQDNPDVYISMGQIEGNNVLGSIGFDISGNPLNGALEGLTLPTLTDRLVPGSPDGAILFEQDQLQAMALPDSPVLNDSPSNPGTTDRTYELWFQARNLPEQGRENRQIIFEEGGTTRGLSIYLDGVSETEADLHLLTWNAAETAWGGEAGPIVDGSTDINARIQSGETYYLAYVMEGGSDELTGTLTGYLNAEQMGQVGGVGRFFDHTDDMAFGRAAAETAFHDGLTPGAEASLLPFFDGVIDEFAAYDGRALSQAEVQAHYDAGLIEVPCENCPGGGGGEVGSFTGISLSGSQATIEWDGEGSLQSASSVEGPYQDVAGGSSPFNADASAGGNAFYRLRE